jgi:hypothetical protein
MELGGIALAACVLSLLCLGLLVVAAFFLAQFAGTTLSDLLDSVLGGVGGDNDDDLDRNFQRKRDQGGNLPTRAEFRQRAQNVDFDEALARYQGGDPDTDSQQQRYQAQAHDTVEERQKERRRSSDLRSPSISDNPDDPFGDVNTRNLRSQRSTRRSDGYEIYDDRDSDGGDGFIDNMLDSF